MTKKFENIETKLIHAGEMHPRPEGEINLPNMKASTFESYHDKTYHGAQ